MKKFLIFVLIIAILGGGYLIYTNPAYVDAVKRVTEKSEDQKELDGEYVFLMGKKVLNVQEHLKEISVGKKIMVDSQASVSFKIVIPKSNTILSQYAKNLSDEFNDCGFSTTVSSSNDTPLRFSILTGNYDFAIIPSNFMDYSGVTPGTYFQLSADNMAWATAYAATYDDYY